MINMDTALQVRAQNFRKEEQEFCRNQTQYVKVLTNKIWDDVMAQANEIAQAVEHPGLSMPTEKHPVHYSFDMEHGEEFMSLLDTHRLAHSWLNSHPGTPLSENSDYAGGYLQKVAEGVQAELNDKFSERRKEEGMSKLVATASIVGQTRKGGFSKISSFGSGSLGIIVKQFFEGVEDQEPLTTKPKGFLGSFLS